MSLTLHRLKQRTVDTAKMPGRYSDGGGLYLVVKLGANDEPRRSWVFLYRRGTKMTELGLGGVGDVTMPAARAEAAELREVLSQGCDPRAHRERKRQAQALKDARSITFETAARAYHERHKAKWHSAQYARQWLRILEMHAFPKVGSLGVGAVDMQAVTSVLEPIWYDKPRVAQLVRANIESVLNFAKATGQRKGDNPAQWDLLRHSLPARKGARTAGHFRALTYSDIPALLKDLAADRSISALCLRFTIFTVARTKETAPCPWTEINFANRTRTVQILKGGHAWQHVVPLSDQAIDLLRGLLVDGKPPSEHVFPARNRRDHLSLGAMLDLIERMEWNDRTTVHGIRAAFKTWATERTNYPREVVELCLSHVQGDPLERAYQRGDILEKRRRLMQEWADFCTTGRDAMSESNVVAIRA
jgi:integrase